MLEFPQTAEEHPALEHPRTATLWGLGFFATKLTVRRWKRFLPRTLPLWRRRRKADTLPPPPPAATLAFRGGPSPRATSTWILAPRPTQLYMSATRTAHFHTQHIGQNQLLQSMSLDAAHPTPFQETASLSLSAASSRVFFFRVAEACGPRMAFAATGHMHTD